MLCFPVLNTRPILPLPLPDNNDDEGIEHDSEEIEEDLATLDSDDGVDAGDCGTTLDDGSGSNLAACGSSLLVAVNGCGGKRKHLETKELDHVLEVST